MAQHHNDAHTAASTGGSTHLLELAKRGDRDAFWSIVEPTLPRLYRSCLALCGTTVDAEDLAQETLLTAWRRIATLRDQRAIGGWLTTIAVRIHLRGVRQTERRAISLEAIPEPPSELDPLGFVEWLVGLVPEQRALLVLRYYYDQPLEDIAQLLGIDAGTIRSRLHYLLRRFRRESGR